MLLGGMTRYCSRHFLHRFAKLPPCNPIARRILFSQQSVLTFVSDISVPETAFHSTACPAVECVALHHPYCRGSVPPGACCPVCGRWSTYRSLFDVFYSEKAMCSLQK